MAFHRASAEPVPVFRVGEAYLFKHYLSDEAFRQLARYYDDYRYRFEVPADRFEHVRDVLEDHGYAPTVVDDPTPFVAAKRKYTAHPDLLFRESVLHRGVGNFNCFLMASRDAVDRALDAGAAPLDAVDVEFRL